MRSEPNISRAAYANPWRPAAFGLAAIAGFIVLFGAWGATAPLASAVIANGSLQVEGRRQKVQHPYGGVVSAIDVREGRPVRRGEVLVTLSDTEARAKVSVLMHTRRELLAEKARLVAERDGGTPVFGGEIMSGADGAELAGSQKALMDARRRQFDASVETVRRQIAQVSEQARGFEAEIEGLRQQVEIAGEDVASGEKLLKAGAASRSRVLALRGRLSAAQAELGARRSDLAAIREKAGEGELKIIQLERSRMSEIINRLQVVDKTLAELQPNLDTARDMLARTDVRAPATGRVVGLSVFTRGGVVEAGATLMEIVPQDNPLFIEAKLKLSDVTDVEAGQNADVRLVGVPRTMRPKLGATIRTISADSLFDKKTGEGYYSLQLALSASDLEAANIALQPGMPVQVIVETRPRTLVSYLAGPLIDEITGAFRER